MAVPCIFLTVRSRHSVFRIALGAWLFLYTPVNRNILSQTYEAFLAFFFPEEGGATCLRKILGLRLTNLRHLGASISWNPLVLL